MSTPLSNEDRVAEWLVQWEEAMLADRPPPALDQLPPDLRPRARESLRLLHGFARMAPGPITTGDAPQVPPDTPRYRFEAFLARGDDLQEQATLYAAGAMTESEREEYARHLDEDQCAVCSVEVGELQSTMSMLAFGASPAVPSSAVRERLMEKARSVAPARQQQEMQVPWLRRWWVELIMTPVAIVAIVTAVAATRANNDLRQLTNVLNSRIAQLEVEVNQNRTYIATLTSPDVRVVDLAGQGLNVQAKGRIFWDQSKKKWLFVARDLQRVSTDKDYQLWFVPQSGNPVSAAVFNTGNDGSVQVEIDVPAGLTDLKAAAVTTEPAGGLPQPTGSFVLLGAM